VREAEEPRRNAFWNRDAFSFCSAVTEASFKEDVAPKGCRRLPGAEPGAGRHELILIAAASFGARRRVVFFFAIG
jgi:hypothetical protein